MKTTLNPCYWNNRNKWKTTNKELLYLVLSSQYNCYATKGNLNNQIGVPLEF